MPLANPAPPPCVPGKNPKPAPSGPLPPTPWWRSLGPGIVAGAADDDPSGIATYSMAGAKLGTAMLWTAWFTWPLMAFVQMMCARVGMVTGEGFIGALRKKFPRWLILAAGSGLFVANTINVAADLSAMGDAVQLLSGWPSQIFVLLFGLGTAVVTVRVPYARLAGLLKWLVLSLFAYVLTAFITHPDWREVGRAVASPHWPKGAAQWQMVVAILGTTISPYLFFWQASQEVEEAKARGQTRKAQRVGATARELRSRRLDVGLGTFFSNLVMFFVILACAMTLHRSGITDIETSRQAADALQPLAGKFAAALYSAGIIGVGLLAIPTLTGSAAYAFAETFGWRQGMDRKFTGARKFYGIVIASTVLGMALDFIGFNPVKALYWSAILNGLLAPFLLAGLVAVAADRKIMRDQPSSAPSLIVVGGATLVMGAAAIAMFVV